MKRIFIAGPIGCGGQADNMQFLHNIGRFLDAWGNLTAHGFAAFCPAADYQIAMRCKRLTIEQLQQASLAWLRVSDAVYLLDGWEQSPGTARELATAAELGIPAFQEVADLLRWARSDGEARGQGRRQSVGHRGRSAVDWGFCGLPARRWARLS